MPAPPPPPADLLFRVGLSLSHSPNFFDERLAAEYKLKPVEMDYFQSEEKIAQVASEMSSLLRSEENLRDLNESMLSMITWLPVLAMLVLVVVGGWQVYYLKGYFRNKKLI
jgi:hypothetical protein